MSSPTHKIKLAVVMSSNDINSIMQTLYLHLENTEINRNVAKEVTSELFRLIGKTISSESFDQNFNTEDTITPSSYKEYVFKIIGNEQKSNELPDLEVVCCNLCFERFYSTYGFSHMYAGYLWAAFVRLADSESFPPNVHDRNIDLILTCLNLKSKRKLPNHISFSFLLKSVHSKLKSDEGSICISTLYSLVVENRKSGWLMIKCRSNQTLSSLDWYWCTLVENSILYYKPEQSCSVPLGSIHLRKCMKTKHCFDKSSRTHILFIFTNWGGKFQLMSKTEDILSWQKLCEVHFKKSNQLKRIAKPILTHRTNEDRRIESEPDKIELPPINLRTENCNSGFHNWQQFISFKRQSKSGKALMTSRTRVIADIPPGRYNLPDIMPLRDLPPLIPKHTVIEGIKWISSNAADVSGKLVFPSNFSEIIATETATNEFLSYYGCKFAETTEQTLTLPLGHCIQDFTYKKGYLQEYVLNIAGGAGLEKHDFTHLDCPLGEDSGFMIIGEIYDEDTLHLTAFKIPPRHTLYIPGGCIHSNDYLQGTWRTMLSNEADIDHVLLVKQCVSNSSLQTFNFKFNL